MVKRHLIISILKPEILTTLLLPFKIDFSSSTGRPIPNALFIKTLTKERNLLCAEFACAIEVMSNISFNDLAKLESPFT